MKCQRRHRATGAALKLCQHSITPKHRSDVAVGAIINEQRFWPARRERSGARQGHVVVELLVQLAHGQAVLPVRTCARPMQREEVSRSLLRIVIIIILL